MNKTRMALGARRASLPLTIMMIAISGCSSPLQEQSELNADGGSTFADLLKVGSRQPALETEAQYRDFEDADEFHPAAVRLERAGADGAVSYVAFDTDKMPVVDGSLIPASIDMVQKLSDGLAIDAKELAEASSAEVSLRDGLTVVTFERKVSGLTVDKAFLQLFWRGQKGSFRLGEIINHMAGAVDTSAAYAEETPDLAAIVGFEPVIRKQGEILFPKGEGDGIRYVRARRYELTDADGARHYTLTIDGNGDVLEAVDHFRSARHVLKAKVFSRSYFYGEPDMDFPLANVVVRDRSDTFRTDESGSFDHKGGNVNVSLQGTAARIVNSGGGSTYFFSATPDGDSSYVNSDEVSMAALNAFAQIHRIAAFVSKHLDPNRTRYLSTPVTVTVNFQGNCNAFYNGSITMYRSSDRCGNMSYVNDVLYHEWGHGLDDHTGARGGITDSAFSEGIGDIVASYMTGSSNMSPGFVKGQERGIRQLDNTAAYPKDRGEAHSEGTIIGGAFWDLREAMIARYGKSQGADKAEGLFFKHLLTTDTYTSSYRTVLALNDDDRNPATRSPDHCLINEAFAAHGLATDEDCEDEVADGKGPKIDEDLFLMLVEEGEGNLTLAVGTSGASEAALCMASKDDCLEDESKRIDLDFAHEKNGRRVFVTSTTVQVKGPSPVTVLTLDDKGEPTAYRALRLERP